MTHTKTISFWAASLMVVGLYSAVDCQTKANPSPAEGGTPVAAVQGGAGTVKGTVKLTGTPPAMKPLKRQADPFCGKTQMNDESVVVNGSGNLQNVAVRVLGSVAGAASQETASVVFDQQNCMYRPRVLAVAAGQKVEVKNSDPVLHNVHCYEGAKTCFNFAQIKGATNTKEMGAGVYKMKCDVHPWMTGYVIVHENPYITVTKADGTFSLPNVPAGTYTVEAWHETFGTKTAQVTVAAGGEATADFTFSAQ